MLRIAITALLLLSACSENVSPRAERVFYRDSGSASWGTVCQLNRRGFLGLGERGYISVDHVTENGTPLVGPKDLVTVSDAQSDWSFLGIHPGSLDPMDYPEMRAGQAVEIHGFPARDRDGEVIPGIAYADDPVAPFWWIELHDSDEGIAAEGVIGGISGSCVFDDDGALVAVVHANGFSQIDGTTHTWAKVVPVRAAILQAQGKGPERAPVAVAQAPADTLQLYEHTGILVEAPAPAASPVPAYTPPPVPAYRIIEPKPAAAPRIVETVPLATDPLVIEIQPYLPPAPQIDRLEAPRWRSCPACI